MVIDGTNGRILASKGSSATSRSQRSMILMDVYANGARIAAAIVVSATLKK